MRWDGRVAPLKGDREMAESYNAMDLLDEVHAVGIVWPRGRGIAEQDGVMARIESIEGTLAQGLWDARRRTSPKNAVVEAVPIHAPDHLHERPCRPNSRGCDGLDRKPFKIGTSRTHGSRAPPWRRPRRRWKSRLPVLATETLSAVMVADPETMQAGERPLLERNGNLHPAINYPTVARGTERLRITPT